MRPPTRACARSRPPVRTASAGSWSARRPRRIAALAAEAGADLIVVGRGGSHSALRRMVFGGTARRIVGLAACPVLIVAG